MSPDPLEPFEHLASLARQEPPAEPPGVERRVLEALRSSIVIDLNNVRKSYPTVARAAVDGVSLSVASGELLVLLGEAGSGKTTLLKMINRLAEPTAGHVFVNGRDVAGCDPVALRRTIGYVFQGVGLFTHLTVGENVGVVPRLLGWDDARVRGRVREMLELVKLPADEFLDRPPDALSGGQQQRVGFARAMAADQRILLLDEPFGALDPLTRDELRRDFKALCKARGATAVMVTHDMTEALLLADRIAVMRGGRIVGGPAAPRELLADPGDDYVRELLTAPKRQLEELEAVLARGAA